MNKIIIKLALSWLRKNLSKKEHADLYFQVQNIANEAFGYGNDNLIAAAEKNLVKRLAPHFNEQSVVFDVGANKGEYLAHWLPITQNIYAFEPGKTAFTALQQKYGSSIHIAHIALGKEKGIKEFYTTGNNKLNSLVKRHHQNHLWKADGSIQVDTIDDYCKSNKINQIDFLKIDTEGYELEVLQGAKNMLKNTKYLQFEFGGAHLDQRVYFRDFYELLSPYFKLYFIVQDGIIPIDTYHEKLENFAGNNFLAVQNKLNSELT